MRLPVYVSTLALVALAGAAHAAPEACVARSTAQRTHLVELYTSEGCSSCPPADRWLRNIQANADVVPLELHVDYWDDLGWKDPFDDHRFAVRQHELASRSARHITYTPEVALDGQEWRGWGRGALPDANAPAAIGLNLRVVSGDRVKARLETRPAAGVDRGDYRAYFALTENGLSSTPGRGENSGALLRHGHTVRAFAGPLALDDAQAAFTPPTDMQRANAAVVAFVQNARTGEVAQVVRLPLARCTP